MLAFLIFAGIFALALLAFIAFLLLDKYSKTGDYGAYCAMTGVTWILSFIVAMCIYAYADGERDRNVKRITEFESVRESVSNMSPGRTENTDVYMEVIRQNKWLRQAQIDNRCTYTSDWQFPDAVDTMRIITIK